MVERAIHTSITDIVAINADGDSDIDIVMSAPESKNTPLILLRNDGGGAGPINTLDGLT